MSAEVSTPPASQPAPVTQPVSASQPQQDRVTDEELSQLDHNEWNQRQAASRRLMQNDFLTEPTVIQAYRRAKTLEQRQRLIQLLQHHYLRRLIVRDFTQDKVGSLGLAQEGQPIDETAPTRPAGVRIRSVFTGFPAAAFLEVGDLIVAVNDRPFPSSAGTDELTLEMRNLIMPQSPGRKVKLKLIRDGQTLELSLPTASMEALRNLFDPASGELTDQYRQGWEQFLQQAGIKQP